MLSEKVILTKFKKHAEDFFSKESLRVFVRKNLGINRRTLLMLLSGVVGALVAFVALLLKIGIEELAHFSFANSYFPFWLIVFFPALGGLLVGVLTYWLKGKKKQGGGVEETIKIIRFGKKNITYKDILLRFVTSNITLGSGGSAGKEAPVVHLGGGIGFLIGRFFQLPDAHLRTLSASGVAAAIAAAFGAPIAGSFFALEILLADFTLDTFAMIIIAAVSAMSVTETFSHLTGHLFSPQFEFQGTHEYFFYIIIGIAGGIINILFVRTLQASEEFFSELSVSAWLKPAMGGLLLGLIALFLPSVMGEGYQVMNLFLSGNFNDVHKIFPDILPNISILLIFLMLFFKIIATAFTVSSGGSGGTIIPALFLGANVGALVASISAVVFPFYTFSSGSWSLAGMISVLAAMTQAPIFSIMLFFELTHSFEAMLPVLLIVSISILVSRHYMPDSLYSTALKKEGIRLYKSMEQSVMESVGVAEIMHRNTNLFDINTSLNSVLKNLLYLTFSAGVVIDKNKKFMGVINLDSVKKYVHNQDICNLLVASEIAQHKEIWLLTEDSVFKALELMDKHDLSWLPVLNNSKEKHPVGFITRKDILKVYNHTIAKRSTQNIILQTNENTHSSNLLNLGEEFHIDSIQVPSLWNNKTIRDLNLRAKFNLTIVGIKPEESVGNIVPDISYKLKTGDLLTYVGKSEDIENFYNQLPHTESFFPFTNIGGKQILKDKNRKEGNP